MSEAPKRIRVWPDYNDHTIPVSDDWTGGYWDDTDDPSGTEYVRRNLTYTRADMEAAIRRALEGAAKKIATQRGTVYDDDSPETMKWINGNNSAVSSALAIIRALDPAQFIEEPKG